MRRTAGAARNRLRSEREASCSLQREWQPVAGAVDKGACRRSSRSRDRSGDRDRFRERLARRKIRVCTCRSGCIVAERAGARVACRRVGIVLLHPQHVEPEMEDLARKAAPGVRNSMPSRWPRGCQVKHTCLLLSGRNSRARRGTSCISEGQDRKELQSRPLARGFPKLNARAERCPCSICRAGPSCRGLAARRHPVRGLAEGTQPEWRFRS